MKEDYGHMNIQTQKVTVSGLVQGIGFRPFVAELAEELQLTGQVKNLGGVVEIIIQGKQQAVDTFIHRLNLVSKNGELPGCRIDSLVVEDIEAKEDDEVKGKFNKTQAHIYDSFRIVESGSGHELRRILPVDLATCDRCVAEMHDSKNRRYRYPFISCTACGPRFSIQKAVPYDRETITMGEFQMCDVCYEEYTQKGNIRRHAQTIACEECGPELRYVACGDADEVIVEQEITGEASRTLIEITNQQQAIAEAVRALKAGKIGAIKDIGGFHFALSPMSSATAMKLREFKNRDKKPFAVMFLNADLIKDYCEVSPEEERLLTSCARPIVLLKKKKDFVPEICGESDRIGALLPCNPLQILLLEETGPLVMTSGNRGGEPIIISDEEMIKHLGNGIDFMLTHNRQILTPLDDSIYQVVEQGADIGADFEKTCDATTKTSYIQLLRRARGLVPEPIMMKRSLLKETFAAGGDLKAAFALGRDEMVYMSQYFGDLDDVRCTESRRLGKVRMEQLLEIHSENNVCDMHPAYISVQEMLRDEDDAKQILQVQHHHAHVASVIAEHGLEGKVLGIACDGTGYGTDGTIWGSEFLLCEEEKMTRLGHFSAVKLLGGDASAKQADLTLLCYMLEARERDLEVESYFEKLSQNNMLQEAAWKQNINTVYSSSMGRLFDAAAALLDICYYNSYEGECAIQLEQAAHMGREIWENEQFAHNSKENIDNILHVECVKIDGIWQANGVKLLVDMYHQKENYSKEVLAYAFHHAVASAIVEIAEKICCEQSISEQEVNQVALSGGTFLNRILTSRVISQLQEKRKDVYINEKVPCGDGGIALGQMYLSTFEGE